MQGSIHDKLLTHFSQYRQRVYAKGQILIHAGDSPEHVFYMETGRVRQYDISTQGEIVVANVFGPGSFVPMGPVITGSENKYFYEAETDVAVRIAPPHEVLELLKKEPAITYDLLRRLYTGTEVVLGRMIRLMSASARDRLLYELVVECHRFGEKHGKDSYFIAIHEGDLAARTGLSRETVSREIHKISLHGEIMVDRDGIQVNDLKALERRLESAS